MTPSRLAALRRQLPVANRLMLALAFALLFACNVVPGATPPPAGPAEGLPTATWTPGNIIMCTPPPCGLDEEYYCPGQCPGGCGTTCATRTPAAPGETAAPTATGTPGPVVQCTPPPCGAGEVYYCPGTCPGGCGTVCATPTPNPAGAPAIDFFRAVPATADPGGTVTLEWQSQGGVNATLYRVVGGQFATFWSVPPTGSMAYTIPRDARNGDDLMLYVVDAAGQTASAALVIPLTCPDAWFFSPPPGECSSGPAVLGPAAGQPFQHGSMIWLASETRIYVLFDDGQQPAWAGYADQWHEGDPESDPSLVPPAGLLQPVRGFGLVWRTQAGVSARLGWATVVEAAFDGAVQRTARFKYNLTFLRALDGGVWELGPEGSYWRAVR